MKSKIKAKLKTTLHDGDVTTFLNSVEGEQKRLDCTTIVNMMQEITEAEPKMGEAAWLVSDPIIISMKVEGKETGF